MSDPFRPRFRYTVKETPSVVAQKFREELKNANNDFIGSTLDYHISIEFVASKRQFWTPHLDLNLEEFQDGTLLRGLIGPRPNVWTVLVFFNALAGLLGVGGIIIGTIQWTMKEPPWALWLLPLSGIIFGAVYLIARAGKQIAYEESMDLFTFFISQLNEPREIDLHS